ncbi:thioredoxin-like protein [Lipomyces japonicus]|uniref:thioredoxin-like protein n=1 Tax=Lipomyces japonicus TaxID=56871 RepID=UPI0034CF3CD7
MDSTTAAVLDSYTDAIIAQDKTKEIDETSDIDDEEFLELLEQDEAALDAFREKRMQELHTQMKAARHLHSSGHGSLTEISDEREVLEITTNTKYSVVHFFHSAFKRCEIMQKRLQELTAKHMATRFISVNVDNAPFLVVRLGVKVLPCVMGFIDGKEVLRLIGFESLGNGDNFSAEMLEFQLYKGGVIQRKIGKIRRDDSILKFGKQKAGSEDDIDDDWD